MINKHWLLWNSEWREGRSSTLHRPGFEEYQRPNLEQHHCKETYVQFGCLIAQESGKCARDKSQRRSNFIYRICACGPFSPPPKDECIL